MYMKKYYRFMLMAALVWGVSFAVTSCKDDDNNSGGNGGGEEQPAEMAAAEQFWSVVANLVNPFDVTADYESKNFEPTIGEPLDGQQTVRVVVVPDAEAAAASFAAIVDADVNASTSSYTYQNDAVGTLSYQKSTDGKSLATVDVSIKQIPHLQRIVYRTGEQQGTNAATGVAYYTPGDVISRTRAEDGVTEYWVCIQAPFLLQGNEECIWATLSQLPAKNIFTYKGSNGKTYKLPTGIGNNKEYMKNLSELVFAVNHNKEWYDNLNEGPATKGFNYLTHENAKYYNQHFWTLMQKAWVKYEVGDKLFGKSFTVVGSDIGDAACGLRLVYNGYSWHTTFSNSPTLWVSTLTTGNESEVNGRHLTWKAVSKNVIKPGMDLNCVTQLKNGTQWINKDFFEQPTANEFPYYIFRFATSKELLSQKPSLYATIASDKQGIEDVYVFNEENQVKVGPQCTPKVFDEGDVTGVPTLKNKSDDKQSVYAVGDVVVDEEGSRWICIFGAPDGIVCNYTDRTAWFISFDNVKLQDGLPTNILTEEDVTDVGMRLMYNISHLYTSEGQNYQFVWNNKLGTLWEHVQLHTKINLNDLVVARDSTWVFTNEGTQTASRSTSIFFNMAYIGDDGKIYIMRVMRDGTQAGLERSKAPHAYQNPRFWAYKQYQTKDLDKVQLSDADVAMGMTKYNGVWPVTGEKMAYEDLYGVVKVAQVVKDDKWMFLNFVGEEGRHIPNPVCSSNRDFNRFLPNPNTGKFTDHLGMFEEPLLAVRLMKVTDNGGKTPNMTAQDGRKLKRAYLQDNKDYYKGMMNDLFNKVIEGHVSLTFLDNELYDMKMK